MFWRQNFVDFNQDETSCVWTHKVMAASPTTTVATTITTTTKTTSKATTAANSTASASTAAATSAAMKRRAHSSSFNGVPLILIINYLLLLCCDVCKSNEYSSTSSPPSSSTSSSPSPSSSLAIKSSAPTTPAVVSEASSIIDQINLNATFFEHVTQNGVDADDIDSIASAEKSTAKIVANVNETCIQRCNNEVDTFLDEFGIKCAVGDVAEKCFVTRCSKGCQHWWRALQEFEPCQEACSSLQFFPFDLPCITACEMAQRDYWHLQRLAMAPIISSIRPQLQRYDSLMLQWPIHLPLKFLASRPFNIQYSIVKQDSEQDEAFTARFEADLQNLTSPFEDTHHSDWSNLADYNCNDNFNCDILDGLMPYTSYRFRFELPFGESVADVLYSPPTDIYQSAPEGAPLSSPVIQNVLALDESHIALYWQPGEFTNGPLKSYKLLLEEVNTNATQEWSIPADQRQYLVAELKPRTNYTLRLSMLNAEGAGPVVETSIMTKDLPQITTEDMNLSKLILVGEYSIQLKSLEPLTETRLVYRSDELISDYAILLESQRIFVIDAVGGLFSGHLSEPNEREALFVNMSAVSFKPSKLAVDWLNLKLYIAGEASNRTWLIARTDLEGNRLEVLSTGLIQPIKQLEVDPINGWLFWLTESGLQRFNLATQRHQTITQKPSFTSFMLDFGRNLLIVYDKSEQDLYELSFDGTFEHKLGANNSKLLQGLWKSFFYSPNTRNIYATNGTHLMHLNNGTHANDVWFIRELEWCWNILPMQLQQTNEWQPQPQPKGSPIGVQALLTANMAKISWQAPALLAHQTPYAWQQWEYELELMDVASNSAFNIRNIKSSYFDVEQLQANNLYKLRVRAAGRQSTLFGEWSPAIMTRTWPRGQHKLLWASNEAFYETNELGEQPKLLLELQTPDATLDSFVQLNGTIFYVANSTLHCANIMNPELNCSFNVAAAIKETSIGCVAYDWRGAKIYWTDLRRNIVLRASLDGSSAEFLPIFDAQQIAIDSYAGHIYYSTGTRLARRMLSGRAESESMIEVEYYHVNGFGGVIRGFTLDLQQQQLYWVVRQNEGHVRLFKSNMTQRAEHKLEDVLLESDVLEGSLEFVPDIDSFVWMQADKTTLSHLIFARSDNLSSQAVLAVPSAMRHVRSVHLKVPYTPYQDASTIPDAVDAQSIRIEEDGYWDDFNVRWSPIAAADNYSVHYKVLLQYNDDSAQLTRFYTLTVAEPLLHLNDFQRPRLTLNMSITPQTAWHAGATVSTQLLTPAEAPTQPKRLRVFIRNTAQPMQSMPNISAYIRWDPPENVSANTAVAYKAYCWLGTELIAERVHNASSDQILETSVGDLVAGETYTFQVQAFAAGRRSGGERTAFQAIHINPEVQAVPMLLYATSEYIAELDMDLDRRRILVHTASEVEHLALMQGEQRLLWVNDNVELLTYVPGAATVKLARMRAEVLALTTDWISRRVYWAELDNEAVSIYELDLCRYEGRIMTGTKLFTTESGKLVRQLVALPFSRTLLWLEHAMGEQNATLAGRNLTDGTALQLKGATFRRMFEGSLSAEMETVNLIDQQGQVCVFDVHRQLCNPLKLHFNVAADVAAIERDNGYIYMLHNGSMRAYDRRKQHLEFQLEVADVRKIKAYNYQPYPASQCLVPEVDPDFPQYASEPLKPNVTELAERYFMLELPELPTGETCWLPIPGVRYLLTILDSQQEPKLNVTLFERNVNITQLNAYTNYTIELRVATYYQQRVALPQLHIPDTIVRTAVGTPSAAQNFTARALSPIEIEVNWLEPAELNSARVWYELHWQMENASLGAHKTLEESNSFVVLTNLLPSTQYTLWLKVYSTVAKFNTSQTLAVQTFEQPRDLQLLAANAYNLTLSWQPTGDASSTFLSCQALNPSSEEDDNEFSIDITNKSSQILITDLKPRTRYEFHLELNYANVIRPYRWPDTALQSFIYETLSDRPGSPGRPQIEHITGEIFRVFWEPALSNGAPIIEYSMEALQSRSPTLKRIRRHDIARENQLHANQTIAWLSQLPWAEEPQPLEDKWVAICNTTALNCIVRETHTLRLLMFRVRARNEPHGWGPYSEESDRVSEPYVSPEKRNSLVIAIIAPAVVVSSCVLLLVIFRAIQKRRVRNKKLLEKSRPSIWSNFSTIQQQQLMASRYRAFSLASHSTMYTGGPLSDADIALLPHISGNQITLLNFLGSGAFGEVYEGLVKHEDEEEPEKVAIKSLRKGASEFAELLKEAQLMSNFKHENIVRLIGVCCNSESISIIMEHMEAGDLLSYLRESRPNATRPMPTLQILDTLAMCIDVATGCSYLEDMHFVHRDLACRNCLVSSHERSKRVVKIGDFGLARDIYKNDYYRKEGEGLLPVRWMSPESLVDGVFSTQSDVWAFGVLCWEILTLGQQPYAARNNVDVLQYVKAGGRLEQPENCPDKLFALMLQCWKSVPEERPTFRQCLNVLVAVKTEEQHNCMGNSKDDDDDDDAYAMYANNQSIVLSTFLANPLPKTDKDEDMEQPAAVIAVDPVLTRTMERNANEKASEMKVRFDGCFVEAEEIESLNDDVSQLIVMNGVGASDEQLNCYTNEAVSRL